MNFLPLGLRVNGRTIAVIGGSRIAAQKCRTLCATTARVRVYARAVCADIRAMTTEWRECDYEPRFLDGAFLVYACTDDRGLNRRIATDARARGALANVADDPADCDIISPALWSREPMTVAVLSDGTDAKRSVAWRNAIRERGEHDPFLR